MCSAGPQEDWEASSACKQHGACHRVSASGSGSCTVAHHPTVCARYACDPDPLTVGPIAVKCLPYSKSPGPLGDWIHTPHITQTHNTQHKHVPHKQHTIDNIQTHTTRTHTTNIQTPHTTQTLHQHTHHRNTTYHINTHTTQTCHNYTPHKCIHHTNTHYTHTQTHAQHTPDTPTHHTFQISPSPQSLTLLSPKELPLTSGSSSMSEPSSFCRTNPWLHVISECGSWALLPGSQSWWLLRMTDF